MTPEQVTKRMGWMYAMLGGGIACLFTAYQYAQPTVGVAEPPPEWAPYLFGGLGLILLIVGGVLALQLKKQPKPAAVDLKNPQGKNVIRLMIAGGIALVALTLVNIFSPDGDPVWLSASVVLLIIMAVCFVSAGRITRKLRAATAAGAAKE
jgi:hypothetical protein